MLNPPQLLDDLRVLLAQEVVGNEMNRRALERRAGVVVPTSTRVAKDLPETLERNGDRRKDDEST